MNSLLNTISLLIVIILIGVNPSYQQCADEIVDVCKYHIENSGVSICTSGATLEGILVSEYCRESCGNCDGTTTATTAETTTPTTAETTTGGCADENADVCSTHIGISGMAICTNGAFINTVLFSEYCRKSCGNCDGTTTVTTAETTTPTTAETTTPTTAETTTPTTAETTTGGCADENADVCSTHIGISGMAICTNGAFINTVLFSEYCRKSCGNCDGGSSSSSTTTAATGTTITAETTTTTESSSLCVDQIVDVCNYHIENSGISICTSGATLEGILVNEYCKKSCDNC